MIAEDRSFTPVCETVLAKKQRFSLEQRQIADLVGALGIAVIGGIVVFFPALVNPVFGLRSAPRPTIDLVTAYSGGKMTMIRKVAVPAALPALPGSPCLVP
ncbi:hypothetical protein [Saccharopolyspora spinosa]|uniref:hypothetical protein n=1 Tax=Saccharopolyspora spinosa TaxID=60894 RepID=UPI000237A11A|nr:hypothetical protein [Saccharopolyspora spinosa]